VWEIGIKRAPGRLDIPADYLISSSARFRPSEIMFRDAEQQDGCRIITATPSTEC
jgi:hypothetical protein